MRKARNVTVKPRLSWLGWAVRILGGAVLACVLAFAGFLIYFTLAVYPKLVAEHAAEVQKAQAFAKLTGAARRLAIYDAFVAEIGRNYYDQTFSGFDWPKMKHDWRPRAAAAKDDAALYNDVLFQMTQRFPSSHFFVNPPVPAVAKHTMNTVKALKSGAQDIQPHGAKFGGDKDVGFQMVVIRRKGGTTMVVGQVWPQSTASKAGITPGWGIIHLTYRVDPGNAPGQVHVAGTFLRLTPTQMHALETTGAVPVRLVVPGHGLSKDAIRAKLKTLQTSVDYYAKLSGPEPSFSTRRLPDGILYIRFDHFEAPSLQKVTAALQTAQAQGVILDLRYNNGGYVMPLLNALLPGNTPVYKSRDTKGLHTISTGLGTRPYSGRLAVLIGPATASAAEITASVLKSRHRAVLVGRATNGSVLGCQFFPLPDGGQVQVPVDDIETMDGKRLEDVGVAPDIEVYPGIEDIRQGKDPTLEMAEAKLLGSGVH